MTQATRDLKDLIANADHRRVDRADQVEVLSGSLERVGRTFIATVAGSHGKVYETRITTGHHRSFWCACRDCELRGTHVGPCKHTIALAQMLLS